MNKTDERVAEEAVVRVLRATRANDLAAAPVRHSRQTPQCPHVARFAAVLKFGDKWSPDEDAHLRSGCPFCARVRRTFAQARADVAQEDTVLNLSNSSDETITGLKLPKSTPPGDKPKPS